MVLAALVVVAPFSTRPAAADAPPPEPSPDAPAYLIVSAPDEDFEYVEGEIATGTILVRIGTIVGGGSISDAHFVQDSIPPFAFPEGVTFDSLDGNQVTVIGSFQEAPVEGDTGETHLVTPSEGNSDFEIPSDIQQAVFAASQAGALDALGNNPTTADIVEAIAEYLPPFSETSNSSIFYYVFDTPERLELSSTTCEGEGSLFPHDPFDAIFDFQLALTVNGAGKLVTDAGVDEVDDGEDDGNGTGNGDGDGNGNGNGDTNGNGTGNGNGDANGNGTGAGGNPNGNGNGTGNGGGNGGGNGQGH
jgi:hypothetical protein